MKKKLLAILALSCACTGVFALASCGGTNDGTHDHNYATTWSHDGTNHYHACTVEGCTEKTDVAAHTFDEGVETAGEGCTGAGSVKYTCTTCRYEKTEPTDPIGHSWGEWTVSEENKPSFAKTGKATRSCTREGCTAVDKTEIGLPLLGSNLYTRTGDTATCNSAGTATFTYTYNDDTIAFTAATPKQEHNWDNGAVTTEPTLDGEGVKTYTCQNSGCNETKTEPIAATGATYTVTLRAAEGVALEGVKVKLGQYEGTADAQGVASVLAKKGSYEVALENCPAGFLYDNHVVVTETSRTAEVWVADSLTSGGTLTSPTAITRGTYAVRLSAVPDDRGVYQVRGYSYSVAAAGEPSRITVKLLNSNMVVVPDETGYDNLSEKNAQYSVVKELGERTLFTVHSAITTGVDEGYSCIAIVSIALETAPEAGCFDRPITAQAGENGKDGIAANEQVYFRVNVSLLGGNNAKITFGEGVSVVYLGVSKNGGGVALQSGDEFRVPTTEGLYAYLAATSTGASCKINLAYAPLAGTKDNPITVSTEKDNAACFNMSEGVLEQWFKITAAEDTDYVLKTESATAYFETYASLTATSYLARSGMGSAMPLYIKANQTVYIRAFDNNNNDFTFRCVAPSIDDEGSHVGAPYTITESGQQKINFRANDEGMHTYYKFEALSNTKVTLAYTYQREDGENSSREKVYLFVYDNAQYTGSVVTNCTNWDSAFSFYAYAGTTYYIMANGVSGKDENGFIAEFAGKFAVTIEPLVAHPYEITVAKSDGAPLGEEISVKLMKGDDVVAQGTTVNGKVTFNDIMPDNYTVIPQSIPAGYGYSAYFAQLPINNDTVTQFTLSFNKHLASSLKIVTPDGDPVAGVRVELRADYDAFNFGYGELSAVTDGDGVASFKLLPLYSDEGVSRGYYATVTLPESVTQYFVGTSPSVAPNREQTFTLSAYTKYTFTLTTEDGTAVEGATVSMSGANYEGGKVFTAETNASGVAEVYAPKYEQIKQYFTASYTLPAGMQEEYYTTNTTIRTTTTTYNITVKKFARYELHLVDSEGNAIKQAIEVTVGTEDPKTTDENGVVVFTMKAPTKKQAITLSGGYLTTATIAKAAASGTINVTCIEYDTSVAIDGVKMNGTPAKELEIGKNATHTTASLFFFVFTAAEAGTYTFEIENVSCTSQYFEAAYPIGSTSKLPITKDGNEKFSITLTEGQQIQVKCNSVVGYSYITVAKAE